MKLDDVAQALIKNRISTVVVGSCADALAEVKSRLFAGAVIAIGGSVTLRESGIEQELRSSKYRFLERYDPALDAEERAKNYRDSFSADFLFCSANAVTEQGELYNVDGRANRVSMLCDGPKKVIVVVGANKIVKDRDQAILRVKQIAAPKNALRLHKKTPCASLGHCVKCCPDFSGCDSPDRICAQYLFTGWQQNPDRISVILVNQSLGY